MQNIFNYSNEPLTLPLRSLKKKKKKNPLLSVLLNLSADRQDVMIAAYFSLKNDYKRVAFDARLG